MFVLDDLIAAMVIGAIVGGVVSHAQAMMNGASVGEAFKAGAIGSAIGSASAALGYGVVAVTSSAAASVASSVTGTAVAAETAKTAIQGAMFAGSLVQGGIGVSEGDYSGVELSANVVFGSVGSSEDVRWHKHLKMSGFLGYALVYGNRAAIGPESKGNDETRSDHASGVW